jgi:hypothetical protein
MRCGGRRRGSRAQRYRCGPPGGPPVRALPPSLPGGAITIMGAIPVFVLIPGAGIDPRVFGATISALADLGHEAVAPPLPLHDERATPSDHADAVATAVRGRGDLVVVAQSLGAFSGALVPARIPVAHLVLVGPMIPKPGETAGEWWANTAHAEAIGSLIARHGKMSALGARGHGGGVPPRRQSRRGTRE